MKITFFFITLMKKSLLLLFSVFLLAGCGTKNTENESDSSSPPNESNILIPSSQYTPEISPCNENVFSPVCAEIKVQCITEPCENIWQDFPNRCQAEKLNPVNIENGMCPPEKGGMLPPPAEELPLNEALPAIENEGILPDEGITQ